MERLASNNPLREIKVYNAYGDQFPKLEDLEKFKVQVESVQVSQLQHSGEMFAPWYRECENLVQACKAREAANREFDRYYKETFLDNKPHGIDLGVTLVPSKRS